MQDFKHTIFSITPQNFESCCLEVFLFQYHECKPYQNYCKSLGIELSDVKSIDDIPFLPIEFFKYQVIKSGDWKTHQIFRSSGTTLDKRSEHHVRDLDFYLKQSKYTMEKNIGSLEDWRLLALLPTYIENGDSSLIEMINYFMKFTLPSSRYISTDTVDFSSDEKTLLFGLPYALLNLPSRYSLNKGMLMETGGMKGKAKEMIRDELHQLLRDKFNTREVGSEYGMTEMFSQAYAEKGLFQLPPWSRVLIRELQDPFSYAREGETGGINIIDLANIDTCAFIETKDLGRNVGSRFEVLGRFDHTDIRGCNLLM